MSVPAPDLQRTVLECLQGEAPRTAVSLAQELGKPKNIIQRCLYKLQEEHKAEKVRGKYWTARRGSEDDGTPRGAAMVPCNGELGLPVSPDQSAVGAVVVPCNGELALPVSRDQSAVGAAMVPYNGELGLPVSPDQSAVGAVVVPCNGELALPVSRDQSAVGAVELSVLGQLRERRALSALQVAKALGHVSSKDVNPSLYTLEKRGLVRKIGKEWLCTAEGDSTDAGVRGSGINWNRVGGTGAGPERPNNQFVKVENHYNITVNNNQGDHYTSIHQHGPSTNNISANVHGDSYMQVGSGNTMRSRDSGQQQGEAPAQGCSGSGGTEDRGGGAPESGGTEDRGGGALESSGKLNIEIITEQLRGLQVGNKNWMNNGWDPSSDDPSSDDPSSDDPSSEGPEEQ